MSQPSRRSLQQGTILCLTMLLLTTSAWAAEDTQHITAVRVKALKLYDAAKSSAKAISVPTEALQLPIAVAKTGKGGWLKISHGGKDYWVRKFQVKTDKHYDLSTQGGCDRIAQKAGGHGGNRGLDGGCPQ